MRDLISEHDGDGAITEDKWRSEDKGAAKNVFSRFFVDNDRPLVFMEGEGGHNRTP
ncbi:MAG: hypothetical protein KAI47_15285 [Deltaproteobacteria bacterium]|nr:hypothetical protein [Deltaproteobacteria bacterium]